MARIVTLYMLVPDNISNAHIADAMNDSLRSNNEQEVLVADWAFSPGDTNVPDWCLGSEGSFVMHIPDYRVLGD